MKHLTFEWHGSGSLKEALNWPFSYFSFVGNSNGIYLIRFWSDALKCLTITVSMRYVGFRDEVGILIFNDGNEQYPGEERYDLPALFLEKRTVRKLVINDNDTLVESGIEFEFDGCLVTIVSGLFPETISISGLSFLERKSVPEMPMEQYSRVTM